jgi:hypothetical protein
MDLSNGVGTALMIVVTAIFVDALLGIIKSIIVKDESFDPRKLPQFLVTGIFPYVGAIGVLAIAAHFVGDPFTQYFFAGASAVVIKYGVDIIAKFGEIFKVEVKL